MRHGASARFTWFVSLATFVVGWCAHALLLSHGITPQPMAPPAAFASLPPSLIPPPPAPVSFTLETFPHLTGPVPQRVSSKILVAIFAGGQARSTVREYLQKLPAANFTVMLFLYDNSSWVSEDIYSAAITIHATRQMKWWFVKRFLSPSVVAGYRALVLVDDDVDWSFSLTDFVSLMEINSVGIAQPARSAKENSQALSYKLTKQNPFSVLRFSDFVECGPLTVIRPVAWQCVWDILDAECSSGWGLDMVWCRYSAINCGLSKNACAIADQFVMHHNDAKTTRAEEKYDPHKEWEQYNAKYPQWHSRMQVLETKPKDASLPR